MTETLSAAAGKDAIASAQHQTVLILNYSMGDINLGCVECGEGEFTGGAVSMMHHQATMFRASYIVEMSSFTNL